MSKKVGIPLTAFLFALLLVGIRDRLTTGRTIFETFSRWEWATNFTIFLVPSFIAIPLVFVGVDYLVARANKKSPSR